MVNLSQSRKLIIIVCIIVYLVYSHFINKITQNIGTNHYNDEDRVYDICHKYLPNYEKYEIIGNIYIIFVCFFTFIKPSKTISIFFELAAFIIPIYLIRSILTLITVLPKSSQCEYNPKYAFINGACYDKIFSGHTAIIFILTLLLNKYNIINFLTVMVLNIVNVSIILLTRTHYTIDIIVSFLVSYIMYTNNIRL
jgi:hypothetical protein